MHHLNLNQDSAAEKALAPRSVIPQPISGAAARIADTLVLAMVVALPWSISAATILAVCWMAALVLSPYVPHVGRELKTLWGALPIAIWALAVLAMSWSSDLHWGERLKALDDFHRLWAIPFLIAQFRISPYGRWVLIGFLCSCTALLVLSYLTYFFPSLSWRWSRSEGVPVKDYIAQSGEFVLCAFGLLAAAMKSRKEGRNWIAAGLLVLAFAFLANVTYIAAGRTAIVVIIGLLIWVSLRSANWRYGSLTILAGCALLGVTWTTSPYLQSRLLTLWQEVQSYHPKERTEASAAVRLEFWRRSISIIQAAPWFGHGAGSVKLQFEKTASGQKELTALVTKNPHNQIFAIVIQLGVFGGVLLILMWISHLWLFGADDNLSLIGSIIVVQNIIGCMFNSHLFDFTQGSLYVIGVGVIGGMVMRATADRHSTAQ
jgi:O-antigen ligase